MADPAFIRSFDAALDAIDAALRSRLRTRDGGPADVQLTRLRIALVAERDAAAARGSVDRAAIGALVRELVTWYPDDQVKLIAAIGAVARG